MENKIEETNGNSNVVSLFGEKKDQKENGLEEKGESVEEAFKQAMRRNMETKERLKRERLKANRSVLRSYRIKD